MKYLLNILLILLSLSLSAQTPQPNNLVQKLEAKTGGFKFSPKRFTEADSLGRIAATAGVASLSAAITNLSGRPGYKISAKGNTANTTLVQPVFQFNANGFTYVTGQPISLSVTINATSNVRRINQIRVFYSATASPVVLTAGTQVAMGSALNISNNATDASYVASSTIPSGALTYNSGYIRCFVDVELLDGTTAGSFYLADLKLSINNVPVPLQANGYALYSANGTDSFLATTVGGVLTSSSAATATAPTSSTLSLENAEKIVLDGNSYWEAIGVLKDKSPGSVLSGLTEYNYINYSTGGRSAEVLAQDITTGVKKFSATYTFPMFKAKYALLSDNQNGKNTLNQNDSTYYANQQLLINTVRAYGVEPILPTEAGGWFATTRDGEQRNLKGLKALADANGIKFIDVVTKSRVFNTNYNARFWKSSHPVTRSTWLIVDGVRKGLKQVLPRPRQSLKIFRVRGTTSTSSTANLLFRTITERYSIWKEISIGHMALSEAQKIRFDTISGLYDGNQTVNDEYLLLRGGNSLSLGTYALIDAVLPVTSPTGLSITVSDTASALTCYARKTTNTGLSWVQLSGSKGVFTVPDNAQLTDYDRASFLLQKTAGVSLSNIYLSWAGGTTKPVQHPAPAPAPKGSELLAQPLVGNTSQLSSWTVTGGISAQASPDNILPTSTTGLVEVTPTAAISQTFTAPISDDPAEVVIRVWARNWKPFYSQLASFSTSPITYETSDIGNLQVTLSGATGLSLSQYSDVVGLHWTEVEFRGVLPANQTATTQIIKVLSRDVNLQIARVSVRLAN